MAIDLQETLDQVRRVLERGTSVRDGLQRLVAYCYIKHPHEAWREILALDMESDISALRGWLRALLMKEPPNPAIQALWFGLYNPVYRNGRQSSGMYVWGSSEFDPADQSADWAGWMPDSYMPADRYAESQALRDIYSLSEKAGARELGEQVLCLGFAALAIREIAASLDRELVLGPRDSRAMAVGFDSGGYVVLGQLERTGWQ